LKSEVQGPATTQASQEAPAVTTVQAPPPTTEQAGAENDISLDVMIYKVRFYTLLSFIRWLPYFLGEKRLTRFWEVLDRWHEVAAKGQESIIKHLISIWSDVIRILVQGTTIKSIFRHAHQDAIAAERMFMEPLLPWLDRYRGITREQKRLGHDFSEEQHYLWVEGWFYKEERHQILDLMWPNKSQRKLDDIHKWCGENHHLLKQVADSIKDPKFQMDLYSKSYIKHCQRVLATVNRPAPEKGREKGNAFPPRRVQPEILSTETQPPKVGRQRQALAPWVKAKPAHALPKTGQKEPKRPRYEKNKTNTKPPKGEVCRFCLYCRETKGRDLPHSVKECRNLAQDPKKDHWIKAKGGKIQALLSNQAVFTTISDAKFNVERNLILSARMEYRNGMQTCLLHTAADTGATIIGIISKTGADSLFLESYQGAKIAAKTMGKQSISLQTMVDVDCYTIDGKKHQITLYQLDDEFLPRGCQVLLGMDIIYQLNLDLTRLLKITQARTFPTLEDCPVWPIAQSGNVDLQVKALYPGREIPSENSKRAAFHQTRDGTISVQRLGAQRGKGVAGASNHGANPSLHQRTKEIMEDLYFGDLQINMMELTEQDGVLIRRTSMNSLSRCNACQTLLKQGQAKIKCLRDCCTIHATCLGSGSACGSAHIIDPPQIATMEWYAMKTLMQTINNAVKQMDILMPCVAMAMEEIVATLLNGVDDRSKEKRGERPLLFRAHKARYEEMDAISTDLIRLSEALRKIKISGTRVMVNYAEGWYGNSLPMSVKQWIGKEVIGEMPSQGAIKGVLTIYLNRGWEDAVKQIRHALWENNLRDLFFKPGTEIPNTKVTARQICERALPVEARKRIAQYLTRVILADGFPWEHEEASNISPRSTNSQSPSESSSVPHTCTPSCPCQPMFTSSSSSSSHFQPPPSFTHQQSFTTPPSTVGSREESWRGRARFPSPTPSPKRRMVVTERNRGEGGEKDKEDKQTEIGSDEGEVQEIQFPGRMRGSAVRLHREQNPITPSIIPGKYTSTPLPIHPTPDTRLKASQSPILPEITDKFDPQIKWSEYDKERLRKRKEKYDIKQEITGDVNFRRGDQQRILNEILKSDKLPPIPTGWPNAVWDKSELDCIIHQEENAFEVAIIQHKLGKGRVMPEREFLTREQADELVAELHKRQACCFRKDPEESPAKAQQRWEKVRRQRLVAFYKAGGNIAARKEESKRKRKEVGKGRKTTPPLSNKIPAAQTESPAATSDSHADSEDLTHLLLPEDDLE